MTTEEIQDGNKLIAEFMAGNEWIESEWQPRNSDKDYHTSWAWLMPVVEKIAEIADEWPKATEPVWSLLIITPIGIVWERIVEFIQWYNKQKD